MKPRHSSILLLSFVWLACTGCPPGPGPKPTPDADPALQIKQLQLELAQKQIHLERVQKQLETLRGLPTDRYDFLIRVSRIRCGRFTRALDENQDGRDDTVVVYLELYDMEEDEIKAAGEVEIELWDLEAEQGRRRIGQWRFGLEETARHWLSGPLTDHYKFKLTWPETSRPRHPNLTLKLSFTDALSGNVFELQKLLPVKIDSDRPS